MGLYFASDLLGLQTSETFADKNHNNIRHFFLVALRVLTVSCSHFLNSVNGIISTDVNSLPLILIVK